MLASGQQGQAANQAKTILDKFNDLADKITKLLSERENQYKDHKTYKEAYDELQRWLTRAQEKMPQLKQRPLSDKLAVENLVAPIDALLNKQAQGEVLLDHLEQSAEVVLPSTSATGQEMIKNDNRALRESFERLFKDLKEQKDQLEVVLVHWRDYKDEYERLSDWLQQIAILIKNQKIALSANLAEKIKQVEDVKEILQRLEDGKEQIDKFNESAQVLLKSHLDTYVNNQLQHLNSRYQVELNLAKDVLKKVETNLEQHQDYLDSLEKSRTWIEDARELIRSCSESSTTTSKEILQQRLDQIQELLHRREEGQNLVHATVNNGEKVLRNTRSDGREAINNELKQLQSDWDKLVKKMSTAKVHLETALLQWADYDSSYNQLQQWITDREAKLQQVSEQKVERTKGPSGLNSLPIGERKATLRETNSIVQDIVSFEPVIQSVTSKAEDLMQAAPASEISNKYETLSKQAKKLYEKQKETVEQHQAFIDAANDFVQWLRISKEKLNKCSEPTGDKEGLGSKLSQLTVLQSEVPEGKQKLDTVLETGEAACKDTDDEDKEIIEEEVALLQDDFDNYVEMVNSTKNLLEVGIVKWAEYENQYQDALDWLAKTEKLVQSYNKLQNSLEDKRLVLEQFQGHLQTLFDWQKDLDKLNMKAQVLLETCADTRISNAVTQLATKYNAILSLAKELMRRLELHYQEHQQHNALYQECQDWVERTREKLNECQDTPSTLQEVNSKLQVVKAIRTSLEQGQNKLRYVLELKEKIIINTEQIGAAKIEEDTENLKQDMEKLLTDVNDTRNKLINRVTQLEEIGKLHKLLQDCLHDVQQQIQVEQDFLNDLSEKKAKLEKFKSIQKELNSQSDLVDKLKAKLAKDKTLKVNEYEASFAKYEDLKQQISDAIQSLENQVERHNQYKQSFDNTMDWIRKTRLEVQKCSDLHEERDKIIVKQANISEIVEKLPAGDALVHKTIECSIDVMKSTADEGKETIKQDIEQLNNDWEVLQVICTDTQKALSHCLQSWEDYTNNYEELKKWLEKHQQLVALEQLAENKTPEDLERCRKLLNEIVSQKGKLEDLNDYCETLMELSSCGWVRDQTVQVQGAYTNLLTNAQGLVSKIEKNLSDHTEFIKAKKELENWLYTAHGSVQDCIGVGDEDSIKDKLETIRLVSIRMTEGQHLLAVLQDAFTKVIETTPANKQENLRESMATLRNSWDQLTIDITSIQAQLKADLARWDSYNETKKQFENWMVESEKTLRDVPKTNGELGEMKTLLERYKNLYLEIENRRIDLDRLISEATELSSWAKKPSVLDDIKQVEKHYLELVKLCDTRKNQLEAELQNHNAYHQQLQDIEKWLLQVSFQLMAHNSLYITNREQTEQQIAQHKVLLEEIESYQAKLDDVKAKGKAQVDLYSAEAPEYKESVEKQLNNVQDSYNSLSQTAIQIRNRLYESLAKFKEYEDTLESIMSNLVTYEPIINDELNQPVSNLKEAHSQLEMAKNMHGKLQSEKSRLAIAVQACEAATACISRPSSPRDVLPPPIPHREMEVRARLEDLIDQKHKDFSLPEGSENRLLALLEHLEAHGFIKKLHNQFDKVQTHLGNISTSVAEFEEKQKQRSALKDWIASQKSIVSDWKLRPTKLRAESAKQELNNMNDLLATINQKRSQLVTEFPLGEEENDELEQLLSGLEEDLVTTWAQKQAHQDLIDSFRQNVQGINSWFDNIVKRIDAIDKGSGLNCVQKQAAISDLVNEFNEQGPTRIDEVKRLGAQVIEIVSNLDSQQVEEQLKSVERRYNDIGKRLQRKVQVLEMTKKGIEDTRNEIEQAREWVKQKSIQLQKQTPLGFESRKMDDKLNSLKSLQKEADNKKILQETLLKRVNSMINELEQSEQQQLEMSLKNLGNEQEELVEKIKSEIDRIQGAANTRRTFEINLEKAKTWLKAKNSEIRKLSGYLPLKSIQVEQEIYQHKLHEAEIKHFNEGDLNDLLKLGNSILKECDESDRERLQNLLDEVKEEYENLKQESQQKISALGDLLQGRKQFENEIDKCNNWLKEAEVATCAEIRAPNLEVLEEQLAKYEKLEQESRKVKDDIDKITEQGKAILPTITESDKIALNDVLSTLRDRHAIIAGIITDRTSALKQNIQQQREAAARLAESLQYLEDIQNQLKELNKPIGSKVEDVQNILSEYERILNDLKANKGKLSDVSGTNIPEFQNVLSKLDDLIKTVEDQIARLKQLLLLREQFIALITDIMTFITKYTGVVRDIEKSGKTVEERIKQYDDIILKIQTCEAMLASAEDKGQQIAADGSAQDRNNVTEQIQSVKQSLQNLRRAVEKQRRDHEHTAAEHRKLASELEDILDWLHANEAVVRSRPLLRRDIKSVEKELENHYELSKNVNKYLDRIREVQETTKNDDGMPSSLLEQLSEANSLLTSLPRELEEREKYLKNNRELRENYTAVKQKLYDWVKEAELRLQAHSNGVDFENILTDLEEHKIYFSSEAPIKELVSQAIQQAADKIWPSLTPNEQEELSREQQQHTQLLKNTLNSAKSQQASMEQNSEVWKDYCQTLDKVKTVVARTQFVDEAVSTLAGLHFNVQKITHALNNIQNQQFELDLLLERVNEISSQADQRNKEKIDQESSEVSEEWATLVSDLENRRDTLMKLSQIWETFEGRWQNLESLLLGIEEKIKHIDTIVRSKQHVIDTIKYIEELQSEAESLERFIEEVNQLSHTVFIYLEESPNASVLKEKLNNINLTYQGLLDVLRDKLSKAKEDLTEIEKAFSEILKFKDSLSSLLKEIKDFYVFDENVDHTEKSLGKLSVKVSTQISEAKDLIAEIQNKYNRSQQLVPVDLSQDLTNLELATETLLNAMEEKNREFKKARTVRTDYVKDVDEIQNWIKKAELKIQDRSTEPHILNEYLQEIQSEITSAFDRYEKLVKNAKIIMSKTRDDEEKAIIQTTIDNLNDQLQQLRSLLDEKKQQVGETLDAWQRFLALYQAVLTWVEEKKVFLQEPLYVSTLYEARQKLHDYSNAAKTCKVASKNLSEMAKELDYISSVTSVGQLPQKMKHAEEAKTEVEARILERNALLQETVEEWEQCEKKMKDVRNWMEKSKSSLESPQNKKRPLRDQHAIREKMVGDIQIQKTKIAISVEKLELHFRSGIGGDAKITEAAEDLMKELDVFLEFVRNQTSQLERAFIQVEQYQMEVQQLRQQIVQLEQQLRTVLAPTYLPHDRDQAARDQQAQAERYRHQINVLLNKIYELDPNYVQPVATTTTDVVTLGVTYADIAAGRSSPCHLDRSASEERELIPVQVSKSKPLETVSTLAPETRSIEIASESTPILIENESANKRGRSPKQLSPEISHVVSKQSSQLLKTEEKSRTRSPSPMWRPGSTTYAEILRGQYKEHEEAQQSEKELKEIWSTVPMQFESSQYAYRPQVSEPQYYQQHTMFEYIQPLPDVVGFIASGQQLLNSGLGTYHNPMPLRFVYDQDNVDASDTNFQYEIPKNFQQEQTLSQDLYENPLQPSSIETMSSQKRSESPNDLTKEDVMLKAELKTKIDSNEKETIDNQGPSHLGEPIVRAMGGVEVLEEIPKDLVVTSAAENSVFPNANKQNKRKKSKKDKTKEQSPVVIEQIDTNLCEPIRKVSEPSTEENSSQNKKKSKKKKEHAECKSETLTLGMNVVQKSSTVKTNVSKTAETTTKAKEKSKNKKHIVQKDEKPDGKIKTTVQKETSPPRTNKIILITHEEVRLTPVVTLKMEFPEHTNQEISETLVDSTESSKIISQNDNDIEIEQVIFGSVKERPSMRISSKPDVEINKNDQVMEKTFYESSENVTVQSKLSTLDSVHKLESDVDDSSTTQTIALKTDQKVTTMDIKNLENVNNSKTIEPDTKKRLKKTNKKSKPTNVEEVSTTVHVETSTSVQTKAKVSKNTGAKDEIEEDKSFSTNEESPKEVCKGKKKKNKKRNDEQSDVDKADTKVKEKRKKNKKIKNVSFGETSEIINDKSEIKAVNKVSNETDIIIDSPIAAETEFSSKNVDNQSDETYSQLFRKETNDDESHPIYTTSDFGLDSETTTLEDDSHLTSTSSVVAEEDGFEPICNVTSQSESALDSEEEESVKIDVSEITQPLKESEELAHEPCRRLVLTKYCDVDICVEYIPKEVVFRDFTIASEDKKKVPDDCVNVDHYFELIPNYNSSFYREIEKKHCQQIPEKDVANVLPELLIDIQPLYESKIDFIEHDANEETHEEESRSKWLAWLSEAPKYDILRMQEAESWWHTQKVKDATTNLTFETEPCVYDKIGLYEAEMLWVIDKVKTKPKEIDVDGTKDTVSPTEKPFHSNLNPNAKVFVPHDTPLRFQYGEYAFDYQPKSPSYQQTKPLWHFEQVEGDGPNYEIPSDHDSNVWVNNMLEDTEKEYPTGLETTAVETKTEVTIDYLNNEFRDLTMSNSKPEEQEEKMKDNDKEVIDTQISSTSLSNKKKRQKSKSPVKKTEKNGDLEPNHPEDVLDKSDFVNTKKTESDDTEEHHIGIEPNTDVESFKIASKIRIKPHKIKKTTEDYEFPDKLKQVDDYTQAVTKILPNIELQNEKSKNRTYANIAAIEKTKVPLPPVVQADDTSQPKEPIVIRIESVGELNVESTIPKTDAEGFIEILSKKDKKARSRSRSHTKVETESEKPKNQDYIDYKKSKQERSRPRNLDRENEQPHSDSEKQKIQHEKPIEDTSDLVVLTKEKQKRPGSKRKDKKIAIEGQSEHADDTLIETHYVTLVQESKSSEINIFEDADITWATSQHMVTSKECIPVEKKEPLLKITVSADENEKPIHETISSSDAEELANVMVKKSVTAEDDEKERTSDLLIALELAKLPNDSPRNDGSNDESTITREDSMDTKQQLGVPKKQKRKRSRSRRKEKKNVDADVLPETENVALEDENSVKIVVTTTENDESKSSHVVEQKQMLETPKKEKTKRSRSKKKGQEDTSNVLETEILTSIPLHQEMKTIISTDNVKINIEDTAAEEETIEKRSRSKRKERPFIEPSSVITPETLTFVETDEISTVIEDDKTTEQMVGTNLGGYQLVVTTSIEDIEAKIDDSAPAVKGETLQTPHKQKRKRSRSKKKERKSRESTEERAILTTITSVERSQNVETTIENKESKTGDDFNAPSITMENEILTTLKEEKQKHLPAKEEVTSLTESTGTTQSEILTFIQNERQISDKHCPIDKEEFSAPVTTVQELTLETSKKGKRSKKKGTKPIESSDLIQTDVLAVTETQVQPIEKTTDIIYKQLTKDDPVSTSIEVMKLKDVETITEKDSHAPLSTVKKLTQQTPKKEKRKRSPSKKKDTKPVDSVNLVQTEIVTITETRVQPTDETSQLIKNDEISTSIEVTMFEGSETNIETNGQGISSTHTTDTIHEEILSFIEKERDSAKAPILIDQSLQLVKESEIPTALEGVKLRNDEAIVGSNEEKMMEESSVPVTTVEESTLQTPKKEKRKRSRSQKKDKKPIESTPTDEKSQLIEDTEALKSKDLSKLEEPETMTVPSAESNEVKMEKDAPVSVTIAEELTLQTPKKEKRTPKRKDDNIPTEVLTAIETQIQLGEKPLGLEYREAEDQILEMFTKEKQKDSIPSTEAVTAEVLTFIGQERQVIENQTDTPTMSTSTEVIKLEDQKAGTVSNETNLKENSSVPVTTVEELTLQTPKKEKRKRSRSKTKSTKQTEILTVIETQVSEEPIDKTSTLADERLQLVTDDEPLTKFENLETVASTENNEIIMEKDSTIVEKQIGQTPETQKHSPSNIKATEPIQSTVIKTQVSEKPIDQISTLLNEGVQLENPETITITSTKPNIERKQGDFNAQVLSVENQILEMRTDVLNFIEKERDSTLVDEGSQLVREIEAPTLTELVKLENQETIVMTQAESKEDLTLKTPKKEKHKRSRSKKKQGKPVESNDVTPDVDTERQISKKSIDKTPTLIDEALQLVNKIETSTSVEIITLENQKVLRDDEKEPKLVVDSTNVMKTQTIEKLIDDILSPTDEISEPVANEPLATIEVVQLENEEEPIIINQKIDGDSNLVQNQSLQTPQKEKRKRSRSRKKGSKTIQPSNLIETQTLTVVKMQEQPDIPTPEGETPPSIEVVNLENEEAIIITGTEIIEKESGASISIVKDQSLQMPKKENKKRSRSRKKESKLIESSGTMETQKPKRSRSKKKEPKPVESTELLQTTKNEKPKRSRSKKKEPKPVESTEVMETQKPTDEISSSTEMIKLENEEVLIITDTETSEAKIDEDSSAATTIVQNQLLQTTKNEKPKRSRSKKKEPKSVESTEVMETQKPTDEISSSTEMIKLENEEVLIITDTETSEAKIDEDSSASTTIVQNQLLQTTKNEKPKRSRSKKKEPKPVESTEVMETQKPTDEISSSTEMIKLENEEVLIITDTETSEAKIDEDSSAPTTIVQNQLLQTTKILVLRLL
ncbi:hypothetical protein FQA39_LY14120 [Lamprigera yunnana]|nr:hypothetical protein FQA39_LY14120 [Lamprigera yunnana]